MKARYINFPSFSLVLLCCLLFADFAVAQAAGEAGPPQLSFGQVFAGMAPMLLCLFLVFYLMVLKPQNDEERKHRQLLDSLKNGQTVITTGGIIGRVAGSGKDYILLDVGNKMKIKVEKDHVERMQAEDSSD